MNRRLYRCRHDRRLAGVAGGVAEYFDLDPTLVRLLWIASIFFWGFGLLLYIVMAIVVPLEPISAEVAEAETVPSGHRHTTRDHGRWVTILGLVLILFGTMALVDRFLPAWDLEHFVVPAAAIGIGALLVANAIRREPMES